MTKEEFNKQIKRYFDSISPERGEVTYGVVCRGSMCKDCMFNKDLRCELDDFFEIMEEFEKWVKEHPPITNKEKMEEVFGAKVDTKCECPPGIEMCGSPTCKECRKWWNKEYKEQNGEEGER